MFLPDNTIVSVGPVIVEDGKVLLLRVKQDFGDPLFMFPGSKLDTLTEPLEDVCVRQTKGQLGFDSTITRPLRTIIVPRPLKEDELVVLVHYLAERHGEIVPGETHIESGWYDIFTLPVNCAPNVYEIMGNYIDDLREGTV